MLSAILTINSDLSGIDESILIEESTLEELMRVASKLDDKCMVMTDDNETYFVDVEYYDGDTEEFEALQDYIDFIV